MMVKTGEFLLLYEGFRFFGFVFGWNCLRWRTIPGIGIGGFVFTALRFMVAIGVYGRSGSRTIVILALPLIRPYFSFLHNGSLSIPRRNLTDLVYYKHCEYQSFEYLQVNGLWHAVAPV